MKIVYMGTPEFAVMPLRMLCEKGWTVELVVTQPDKARDRGKKIQYPPVKEEALTHGISVIQPDRVKDNPELMAELNRIGPDLIVVAAYGKILPAEILDLPPLGCINIHASLLPRYRGAAPIQRSVLDGEEFTGVTLMYMAQGLDTGDMIASRRTPVAGKTSADLHDELSHLGAELLLDTLPEIKQGTMDRIKQDDGQATYAPMISKKDGEIDFWQTPEEIERLIRALNPWPGAYAYYQEQPVKFWQAEVLEERNEQPPGTVTSSSEKGIAISAGGKTLLVTKLQMPGKKAMSAAEFIKGNRWPPGAVLQGRDER